MSRRKRFLPGPLFCPAYVILGSLFFLILPLTFPVLSAPCLKNIQNAAISCPLYPYPLPVPCPGYCRSFPSCSLLLLLGPTLHSQHSSWGPFEISQAIPEPALQRWRRCPRLCPAPCCARGGAWGLEVLAATCLSDAVPIDPSDLPLWTQ